MLSTLNRIKRLLAINPTLLNLEYTYSYGLNLNKNKIIEQSKFNSLLDHPVPDNMEQSDSFTDLLKNIRENHNDLYVTSFNSHLDNPVPDTMEQFDSFTDLLKNIRENHNDSDFNGIMPKK